jgi:hypothetical protein
LRNVTSNNRGRISVRQKIFRLTKKLIIFLIALGSTKTFGQISSADTTKEIEYEICVFKKSKPGQVVKNHSIGIADTIVAYVSGQVFEKKDEPTPYVNISFTNSSGRITGVVTDVNGKYSICLDKGEYTVKFKYLGFEDVTINKLKLGTGQMQEIIVDLGWAGGYYTYVIPSKKPLTEKEIKAKTKELTDE